MERTIGQAWQEPFVDLYEILQVSPKAEQETIERVFRLLAKKYHPDNHATGDAEKFNIVTKAYRLLSDPEKRREYDGTTPAASLQETNTTLKGSSSQGGQRDREISQAILSILYIARRRDPLRPGLGNIHLEKLLGCPEKQVDFHIWYLKEKGWIQVLETGGYAITASGVDVVMEEDLLAKKGRLLPAAEFGSSGQIEDLSPSEKAVLDSLREQLSS
jgi:curved DNA-binding protein